MQHDSRLIMAELLKGEDTAEEEARSRNTVVRKCGP